MDAHPKPPARPRKSHPARARLLGPTLLVAVFLATLFTAWTPSSLSVGNLSDQ